MTLPLPPCPSQDLAKLVLGYLAEEQLLTVYNELLQASPYLDARRNQYDRILISLKSILSEYRAVKIYVETCNKPYLLRKKLFQCPNLLDVVKLLVTNVDTNKLQEAATHSVEKPPSPASQWRTSADRSPAHSASSASSVETTPLADLFACGAQAAPDPAPASAPAPAPAPTHSGHSVYRGPCSRGGGGGGGGGVHNTHKGRRSARWRVTVSGSYDKPDDPAARAASPAAAPASAPAAPADERKARPVRRCAKNVSYYGGTPARESGDAPPADDVDSPLEVAPPAAPRTTPRGIRASIRAWAARPPFVAALRRDIERSGFDADTARSIERYWTPPRRRRRHTTGARTATRSSTRRSPASTRR